MVHLFVHLHPDLNTSFKTLEIKNKDKLVAFGGIELQGGWVADRGDINGGFY